MRCPLFFDILAYFPLTLDLTEILFVHIPFYVPLLVLVVG